MINEQHQWLIARVHTQVWMRVGRGIAITQICYGRISDRVVKQGCGLDSLTGLINSVVMKLNDNWR